MNKELFQSMQKQLAPSPQVRAELTEKLARPAKKRPVPWMKYGAIAACAALMIGMYAVYQTGRPGAQSPTDKLPLHSYVMMDCPAGYVQTEDVTAAGVSEGADQDMEMTPEELAAAMLDAGYTQDEINEYQSIGCQMTWASWWKFVHQQENSEGDDPFNLDNLKTFSQKELHAGAEALPAPNTGDLPGGAYVGDAPSQEEASRAYRNLLPYLRPLPDWCGGAYIDQSGRLVVQLVSGKDLGDKSLELQVLDWAGSDQVLFTSCKYSLAHLNELMDRLNALREEDPECGGVMAGWGIDEVANRIELTLTEVNDHVLSVLAQLDPEDDVILVKVGQRPVADVGGEDVRTDGASTEDPAVSHVMPGGVTVPQDEDLIAVEPIYEGADYDLDQLPDKLPGEEQPADTVQSVPEEDGSASAPSFDPNSGFSSPFSGSQS